MGTPQRPPGVGTHLLFVARPLRAHHDVGEVEEAAAQVAGLWGPGGDRRGGGTSGGVPKGTRQHPPPAPRPLLRAQWGAAGCPARIEPGAAPALAAVGTWGQRTSRDSTGGTRGAARTSSCALRDSTVHGAFPSSWAMAQRLRRLRSSLRRRRESWAAKRLTASPASPAGLRCPPGARGTAPPAAAPCRFAATEPPQLPSPRGRAAGQRRGAQEAAYLCLAVMSGSSRATASRLWWCRESRQSDRQSAGSCGDTDGWRRGGTGAARSTGRPRFVPHLLLPGRDALQQAVQEVPHVGQRLAAQLAVEAEEAEQRHQLPAGAVGVAARAGEHAHRQQLRGAPRCHQERSAAPSRDTMLPPPTAGSIRTTALPPCRRPPAASPGPAC